MALIDSEGFGLSTTMADYFTYSAWRALGGNASLCTITSGGPQGDNYLVSIGAAGLRRLVASTPAALITGFRAAFSSATTSYVYFRDAAGAEQCHVEFNATGQISLVAASGAILAGPTAAGTVPGTLLSAFPGTPFAWCFAEIGATISPTAGAVTVRINGVVKLAATGVNTNDSGAGATISFIDWGNASGTNTMPNGLMHIYISDLTGSAPWNSYLGDVRVQTLRPTATDAVQFAPQGLAANWSNAALALPVPGTDYNFSPTVGQQDTFAMQPVSATFGVIYGVHVKALLAKSDAGARSGATALKSAGVTAIGATTPLSVTPTQVKTMYQADPATTAQWTPAAAGVTKAGYKVAA